MDYVYIRAWGRDMGSHSSYIADQVAQARKDKAPSTATYKTADGTWMTMADIMDNATGNATRERINAIAEKLREAA